MPCAASTRWAPCWASWPTPIEKSPMSPRLDDRDIHCLPAERRQLALGWRAIVFAHWQIACSAPGDTLCWVGAKVKR